MNPVLVCPDQSLRGKAKRALTAILVEHRLPNKIDRMIDRWRTAPEHPFKIVRVRDTRLTVRRCSRDLEMACKVLEGEYFPPGYEIALQDTVIDVGGNVGSFAITAARKATAGRVFTFEPDPTGFSLLQENLRLNGITNVLPTHAAVGGTDGQLTLYLDSSHSGRASLIAEHVHSVGRALTVPAISLSTIFESHRLERCHFLKLDCEGAEYEILYSLPAQYFSRIDRIALEYHGSADSVQRQRQAIELVDYLGSQGFLIDTFADEVMGDCGKIFARQKVPVGQTPSGDSTQFAYVACRAAS